MIDPTNKGSRIPGLYGNVAGATNDTSSGQAAPTGGTGLTPTGAPAAADGFKQQGQGAVDLQGGKPKDTMGDLQKQAAKDLEKVIDDTFLLADPDFKDVKPVVEKFMAEVDKELAKGTLCTGVTKRAQEEALKDIEKFMKEENPSKEELKKFLDEKIVYMTNSARIDATALQSLNQNMKSYQDLVKKSMKIEA